MNTDPATPYEVHRGDRIAQLVICRVEEARFVAVDASRRASEALEASVTAAVEEEVRCSG